MATPSTAEMDDRDNIYLSEMDANTTQAGLQHFVWAGQTSAPTGGKVGFYRSGMDTIIVGNTGANVTFEIELDGFNQAVGTDDIFLS